MQRKKTLLLPHTLGMRGKREGTVGRQPEQAHQSLRSIGKRGGHLLVHRPWTKVRDARLALSVLLTDVQQHWLLRLHTW